MPKNNLYLIYLNKVICGHKIQINIVLQVLLSLKRYSGIHRAQHFNLHFTTSRGIQETHDVIDWGQQHYPFSNCMTTDHKKTSTQKNLIKQF